MHLLILKLYLCIPNKGIFVREKINTIERKKKKKLGNRATYNLAEHISMCYSLSLLWSWEELESWRWGRPSGSYEFWVDVKLSSPDVVPGYSVQRQ